MASLSAAITQGCAAGGGVLTVTNAAPGSGAGPNLVYTFAVADSAGVDYGFDFAQSDIPIAATSLPNSIYQVQVRALDTDSNITYFSRPFTFEVACGPTGPGMLVLDSLSHTDETVALNDGTATIQASGGLAPLTAELLELSLSQPATSGQPVVFTALPPATYTLSITDSTTPTAQVVSGQITVQAYTPPIAGCQDEYADNYDPAATTGGYASCTYTPLWRSAWQPMAVRVAAVAGQVPAFIAAELRIGFRPGHPLAADRPLGAPLALRATVGPDGYATFVLGPYLRPALGAADGAGGYRLDLNSPTAFDADLYVGYELRRAVSDELLEHGYALNAAVPDVQLLNYLNPFYLSGFPVWPGFSSYTVMRRGTANGTGGVGLGDYGVVYTEPADGGNDIVQLPCPLNPLPVAWLAPGGGYGFWVFAGKPVLGDAVGEGQRFREASSGEQRFSDPGEAYQTFKATSGVFKGDALLTGLRTLWRSPQAWVQLGGQWLPIVVERGTREVGRLGVLKNEVPISFQLAAPEWAQGQ